jgi:hypothetical protein|tara:strand:+ start:557 stop:1081 length:525 start_codon:yes stop_codon:yes gene_type:complete
MTKIITHLEIPVKKQIFFYEVQMPPFDENYFIQKIEEGIKLENNFNYKTNVKGFMTSWQYFNQDKEFHNILTNFFEGVNYKKFNGYTLKDSWGLKCVEGNKTEFHDHLETTASGVFYLTDSTTPIIFPQLEKEIYPKKGKLLFFDSTLLHGTNQIKEGIKYAIAFNLLSTKAWD